MIQYLYFWSDEYSTTNFDSNVWLYEYGNSLIAKYPKLWYNTIVEEVRILNELFEEEGKKFRENLISKQVDTPQEFNKTIGGHFWELI